jgi:hypothetical protein
MDHMKREKTGIFLLLAPLLVFFLIVPIVCAQGTGGTQSTSTADESISESWTVVNANPGWLGRRDHASVRLPEGILILAGGYHDVGDFENDVWQSTDNGVTWTRLVEHAGWQGRFGHGVDVAADGSLILTGGHGYGSQGSGSQNYEYKNDVWKSTDNGVTWTRVVAHAGWSKRGYHSHVVLSDGSIVLMGGVYSSSYYNDVWRSVDNGATWTEMTAHAGWKARALASSGVMPDGSIILMGGNSASGVLNDVWRSTDNGATWTLVNPSAGWSPRDGHTSIVMPDDSVVLIGGADHKTVCWNDIWRFQPTVSMPKNQSEGLLVIKTIKPVSLKQGTEARISITVFNRGATSVHDVEILDTTLPEFPVVNGITQYSAPLIEPNDTRILTYTVHATKPGSFRFNRTTVMYADQDGNYHITYSDYQKVEVLASLIPQTPQKKSDDFIRNFFAWFNELGRNAQTKPQLP